MIDLTMKQARQFLLIKNGLMGGYRFRGKQGAMDYVKQAGCIQFDPIDVCGRSADLALLSRVKGYKKEMLDALLYRDRALIDYYDKVLSIFPMEDWPCFARTRRAWREGQSRNREQVEQAAKKVLAALAARGPMSSRDLDLDERIDWYWSVNATLGRAVLETLYARGDLVVHHKSGTTRYYARACDCLPDALLTAPDPHPDDGEYFRWMVLRRIGAVGMLWNRSSDALLGSGMKEGARSAAFAALEAGGAIASARIEGIKEPLYYRAEDMPLLEDVRAGRTWTARTEFLAPLDCMLWDRRLIEALFGFHYRWEIYTPASKRQYGYYVLPILRGDRLIGRIEPVCDRKRGVMQIKNLWLEDGVRRTPALERDIDRAVERLRAFNDMSKPE